MLMTLLKSVKRFWTGSIPRQLTIGVALVHAVLMTIFVFDLVGRQHEFLSKERMGRGTELARMLAAGTVSRVLADDIAGLAEEMNALKAYPAVQYGMIVDPNGRVLAHTEPHNAGGFISDKLSRTLLGAGPAIQHLVASSSLIDTAAPIIANERIVGWVRIGLTGTDITESIRSVALNGVLYTLLAIGTGILLATLMARGLTRGLRKLTAVASRVRAGDREVRAETEREDELGELGRGMNSMLEAIAISERSLRVTNDTLGRVIDASPVGIVSTDRDQNILTWNRGAERIFGMSGEEAVGRPARCLVPAEEVDTFKALIERASNGEIVRSAEVRRRRADGTIIDVSSSLAPLYGETGRTGFVAVIEDITERKQAATRLAHLASHDSLTGLPNREQFTIRTGEALERAKTKDCHISVLCFDLDRFGNVNETLGHSAGDKLLQFVAGRLRDIVNPGDVVSRLGGHEFAVLQPDVKEPADSSKLARRVINELGAPYVVNDQEASIGVNVGIAIGPEDSDDPALLLKKAGLALARAKADGCGSKRFFEPSMDAQLEKRRSLERDLRNAIAKGELELHYQPLVQLDDGKVSGCEALLRWRHPQRGMIPPGDFISIAEYTNLIVPIGEWVLWQACTDAAGWPGCLKVAVNLSTVQFRSTRLLPAVVSALASSGLSPARLELEVTESVLMQDNDDNLAVLHQLRGLGARIAMDDFGTGYSSLGYLRSFPFDKIKIDRSFVKDLPASDECLAIVRAIVGLAKSLRLSTTAEGVETDLQLNHLRAEGCIEGQGYLFSRPLPNAELHRFLAPRSQAVSRIAS